MNDILSDLTDTQREAVTHINGPLLVVAGPGSGKTRVITRRIAHLVHCGIRPWSILAITFTNKAAGEMRERVDELVTERGVWISTFHAFCARRLRKYAERLGYRRDFTIFDAADSRGAVAKVLKELDLSGDDWKPPTVLSDIGAAKSRAQSPDDFAEAVRDTGDYHDGTTAQVYAAYQRLLREANAMDFDDLLMQMARLLETDSAALEALQRRHEFVLVDEFQDTNATQYTIARLLAEKHRNLCVTGDPDQSIYGWRGAQIRNILDFERDFPGAKTVFLDRNYRSTQTILSAADGVVGHNADRKERKLYTTNAEGEKILLIVADDARAEAAEIAEEIARLLSEGAGPADIAVFYRVNWLSRQIEQAFMDAGIPYQIVGGVEFYNRKEIKDILAYLRVAANPADEISLLRIINVPARKIGRKSVEALQQWAAERGIPLLDAVSSPEARSSLRCGSALEAFCRIITCVREAAADGARAAVEAAIGESGYAAMLLGSKDKRDETRLENLQELVSVAAEFDAGEHEDVLAAFLEQAALVSDIDGWHEKEQKVTLMTMHAAKGLEFGIVFVAGLEESILPHERSAGSADEIEEERRIFFVAMTRAMEKLYITRADERMVFGSLQHNIPSRFLREIPAELVEIVDAFAAETSPEPYVVPVAALSRMDALPSAGARVWHDTFGMGIIESVSCQGRWHKATVRFAAAGTKKLILEKAVLEIVTA